MSLEFCCVAPLHVPICNKNGWMATIVREEKCIMVMIATLDHRQDRAKQDTSRYVTTSNNI